MLANLNDVLLPAKKKKYAVGLFNAVNLELARGIISAAEATQSPVIMGSAEVLLPYGPLEEISYFLLPMAKKAHVPVVIHLDHGLKKETCLKALELGFSSIMYDCSTDPYEVNVSKVREMAEIAHSYGATIEGELGHVGDNPDSAEGDSQQEDPSKYFTDPAVAKDYVERTGVDALAIAVGNAHGAYKLPPKLDFERIRTIAHTVNVPLVLHGGSGLTDNDFRRAIHEGISKVNIFTDINVAAVKAEFRKFNSMEKGIIDLIPAAVEAVKQECQTKMELFSSCGHAADGLSACAGKKTDVRMGKMDQEMLVKLIAQEVQKQLHNRS
ncbi:MAG: class II fructose-bisphosphate aldolase [Lachnospiraceae bacterium]|nr:class II fructose-bisphosphate aldolase [Lachnospiraceae bacterium]